MHLPFHRKFAEDGKTKQQASEPAVALVEKLSSAGGCMVDCAGLPQCFDGNTFGMK